MREIKRAGRGSLPALTLALYRLDGGEGMTHPLGEGATIRRDVRDASEATSAALDSVLFIAREALTPAQAASLAGVVCHLRKALAGLDAIGEGIGEGMGEGMGEGEASPTESEA